MDFGMEINMNVTPHVLEVTGLCCLPDAFVKHLGAKHLLLIQAYGAKRTEIPLSIWARDWTQVLRFTCKHKEKNAINYLSWYQHNNNSLS